MGNMKTLVTGGAGFIGSNLVEGLVEKGHDVLVLDNFFLGRKDNLKKVLDKVEVVSGDLRDFDLLKKVTKDVDVIFNQAAASSSPMFKEKLREAVAVNVDGFVNILNAAKENCVKKVIYASTSSVYGNSPPPLREGMKIVPVNFYASTKLLNEHLAILFSKEYGLETIGFRYMSVYGPHEQSKGIYANLVSQFLWSIQKDENPVIYGDGKQTRDFVFVKDVVQANILAMESKKKILGGVYNVGSGKDVNLNDLVNIINKILNKNVKPTYVDMPVKNYIATQLGDLTKIKKEFGYKPKYDLESGIRFLS